MMISKTHRRTVVIGDWFQREDEFHVRLFADENAEGQTQWVDFQIFQVIGNDEDGGARKKFFNRRDSKFSPDPVYSYDEAEFIVSGHVKWDGCMEFETNPHTCGRRDLEGLLAVIAKGRELAADEMPGMIINDEYRE